MKGFAAGQALLSQTPTLKKTNQKSEQEWKHLFKELDELLLQNITSQIQSLCSYFRMEIQKHLIVEEGDDGSEFDLFDESKKIFGEKAKLELPDHVQQLLIEYTCLPVCRISVDPTPSSKFSLSFINDVLFKQLYINTTFSENVAYLFTSVIIPILTDGELPEQQSDSRYMDEELMELKKERKSQFIDFLNGYFASLVFLCQYELLKQLTEWMYLFSTNVKIWIIKAFFTKYLTTSESKCKPLRELAQKVLSKYQSLVMKEEGSFIKHITEVEFLTDKIKDTEKEKLVQPPITKATIASKLVINILEMANDTYSNSLGRRIECLNHCIQVLKYGNLYSIVDEGKKKPLKGGPIRGFSLLLTHEHGEKMIELIWQMAYSFIDVYDSPYFSTQPNRNHFVRFGTQLITLFDLVYRSIENKEVTNFFYLNDCYIPFLNRLLKALNTRFENKEFVSLKYDCKMACKATRVFIKHSTRTSNTLDSLQFFSVHENPGHCSKMKMKAFVNDISNGALFESLLNPAKFLFKETLTKQKMEQLYNFLETNLLHWTNFLFYLFNACSLEIVTRKKDDAYDSDEETTNLEAQKFRHSDKLNIIFTQLIECACMLDYNFFINKSLAQSPTRKFSFSKKAQDLNELARAILVVILQKPSSESIFNTENRAMIQERLGSFLTEK